MRERKREYRAHVLSLKRERTKTISELKDEELIYFETETARRRLEEQHQTLTSLSRLANCHKSPSNLSLPYHCSLFQVRKREQVERALLESSGMRPTLRGLASSISQL